MKPPDEIVPDISDDEFFAISRNLERHHAVFYKLWELGKPTFDPRIPTAQVEFDRDGSTIAFVFNPQFWLRLDPYEREFVIAHECGHVILNHGHRCRDTKTGDMANFALDIVINHLLVDRFGYDRSRLKIAKDACWVDTVFKGKRILKKGDNVELVDAKTPGAEKVPIGKSFEFYYLLLRSEMEKNPGFAALLKALESLDGHGGLSGRVEDLISQLNESLSPGEKDSLKDILKQNYQGSTPEQQAGDGVGQWTFIKVGPVKRKKKWETVIKQWSKKYWKPEDREIEQWARINRRYASLSSNLLLPSDMEIEHDHEAKGRIDVWFFQDTSGSCYHLKERFFRAALSLPPERFNVRVFCFDTVVHETNLESKKVYGGGGTSFRIIESYIQRAIVQEKSKYPEAVFIITDGMGDSVKPEKPDKWYFFLSYSCTHYVPKESKIFMLKDFE